MARANPYLSRENLAICFDHKMHDRGARYSRARINLCTLKMRAHRTEIGRLSCCIASEPRLTGALLFLDHCFLLQSCDLLWLPLPHLFGLLLDHRLLLRPLLGRYDLCVLYRLHLFGWRCRCTGL